MRDWKTAGRSFCGFWTALRNLKAKRTGGENGMISLLSCFLFFILFFFLAPLGVTAQTPPEAAKGSEPDAIVVVMPVKADTESRAGEFQNMIVRSVDGLEGYISRPLLLRDHPEYASAFPNATPAPVYVQDTSYAITSEYYLDTDNRQRFQIWLWESATGAPIFTDEMVFDDMGEAMDYLPGLVSWVISLIPPEVEPQLTREEVREIVYEILAEMGPQTAVAGIENSYFNLYLGMWGGGSLATYTTRAIGDFSGGSSQGFNGELAFSIEYRPWRYLSFQAEAILLLESLNVYKLNGTIDGYERYTSVSATSLSLITPLLVKLPFEIGNIGLRLSLGPYFILPLTPMSGLLGSLTGVDVLFGQMSFPFGFCAGLDIGYRLGSWELFGGLRYSKDLSESTGPADGPPTDPYRNLRFNRERITIAFGFRLGFFETDRPGESAEKKPAEEEAPLDATAEEAPPDAIAEEEVAVE